MTSSNSQSVSDGMQSTEPMMSVSGVCKRFGPTIALDNVALDATPGRVLALIGENGAGKSTLLKVLSGAHQAESGTMTFDGRFYAPSGPSDARNSGVAMIYQELNVAPDLSIEDNILLGQSGTGIGSLIRSKQRARIREVLHQVGLGHLSPQANTGRQSVAARQLIEVARALASDAKLILFDEPTSSLPHADVERLFQIIRRLKNQGLAIIYISHFLEEVREIADDYAVLRDGESVGSGKLNEINDAQIVSLMVGRDVNDLFPSVPHSPGDTVVRLDRVSGTSYPTDVSVDLRRGEIFGIAGLVGAGRTELLRTVFGLEWTRGGSVTINGRLVATNIRKRMKAGLGLLSEDRKTEGLAQELSISENMTMGNMYHYAVAGFVDLPSRRQSAEHWAKHVELKAHSVDQSVSELSGGNQQKVALARILKQDAQILLLDEPTKGIDVGTKSEIYRMMGDLAAQGKTIVFVSSYLPELLAVCDRIGVMARGKLVDVRDAEKWTKEDIMAAATETEL